MKLSIRKLGLTAASMTTILCGTLSASFEDTGMKLDEIREKLVVNTTDAASDLKETVEVVKNQVEAKTAEVYGLVKDDLKELEARAKHEAKIFKGKKKHQAKDLTEKLK